MPQTSLDLIFRAIDRTAQAVGTVQGRMQALGSSVAGFNQRQQQSALIINETDSAMKGLTGRVDNLGGKFQNAGQSLALGFTVPLIATAAVLTQFDRSAAKLQVGEAFERTAIQFNLSADEIVESLGRASGGTISNLNLMQAASRAMVLGVGDSTKDFVQLMEVARDRARVFGLSTTQAFNDLTLGIGRQSRLILDNLGIIVRIEEALSSLEIC